MVVSNAASQFVGSLVHNCVDGEADDEHPGVVHGV